MGAIQFVEGAEHAFHTLKMLLELWGGASQVLGEGVVVPWPPLRAATANESHAECLSAILKPNTYLRSVSRGFSNWWLLVKASFQRDSWLFLFRGYSQHEV